MDTT
jgi:ketosteroid isomerase-like protein